MNSVKSRSVSSWLGRVLKSTTSASNHITARRRVGGHSARCGRASHSLGICVGIVLRMSAIFCVVHCQIRTRDLMISSQRAWALDHEAGQSFRNRCAYFSSASLFTVTNVWQRLAYLLRGRQSQQFVWCFHLFVSCFQTPKPHHSYLASPV